MARIAPLPLRFVDQEWTADVPSPPHDALDPEARRQHLRRHPRSFLAVTRAPDDAEPGREQTAAELLEAGRSALEALLADDVFGPTQAATYHLYRLEQDGHCQTGLVAGVSVDDYDSGLVRVHERVNRDRARHLALHLDVVGVQSSPIALAFVDTGGPAAEMPRLMAEIVAGRRPFLDFTGRDGLRQRLWPVIEPEHQAGIEAALAGVPLYLIDGHHRAEAASKHRARRGGGHDGATAWMLATLFPLSELRSQPFHRVLAGIDVEALEQGLRQRFAVRATSDPPVVAARGDDELAMVTWAGTEPGAARPRWLLFAVPVDRRASALERTDPVRLGTNVLGPVLGLDESMPDRRLRYRPGLADEAAIAAMTVGEGEVVFLMRPVANATLVEASDLGLVMPPKSTYFLPKVRSGLMLRHMD